MREFGEKFNNIRTKEGKFWLKDFVSFIKNYSTRYFIYFSSEISIELYKEQQNKSEDELKCSITFPLNAILRGFIHQQVQVMLSAWDIQDMAYLSIVNANFV